MIIFLSSIQRGGKKKITFLSCCRFESLLFKFEVLDHKARERAGVITPTFGSPIPVLLQLDAAFEVSSSYTFLHTGNIVISFTY